MGRTAKKTTGGGSQPTKVPTPKIEDLEASEVRIAEYQTAFSFRERLQDSLDCLARHPECVPVIIERAKDFLEIKELEKTKFLFNAKSKTA